MPNIDPATQRVPASGIGVKALMILASISLSAFLLIPPLSATQRMVLAEGYTNYQ